MENNNLTEKEFIKEYVATDKYPKASNTVDTALFKVSDENKLQVLMIKRAGHPFKDHWALVGGFMDMDETLEESAIREFKEETDVDLYLEDIEQFKTYSKVDRDKRNRVLSTVFVSYLGSDEKIKPVAKDDALETNFLDITLEKLETKLPFTITNDEGKKTVYIENRYKLSLKENDKIVGEAIIKEEITRCKAKNKKVITEEKSTIAFDHATILFEIMKYQKEKVNDEDFIFNLLPVEFEPEELTTVYNLFKDKMVEVDVVRNLYFTKGKLKTTPDAKHTKLCTYNNFY